MNTEFRIAVPSVGQKRGEGWGEGTGRAKGTASFVVSKFEWELLGAHLMLQNIPIGSK